jgi:hypothetical protein
MIISEEDYIAHFGVRGMHWGIRKGKDVTGVSRTRGMLLDRNSRQKSYAKKAASGEKYPILAGAGKAVFLGDKRFQAAMTKRVARFDRQDQRLLSNGKLQVRDRLDVMKHIYLHRFGYNGLLSLVPRGMVISKRPKDDPFVNPKTGQVIDLNPPKKAKVKA